MSIPRFGTDGLRGKANEEITQRLSYALGLALVDVFGAVQFIVGRDTRESGPDLEAALAAAISSAGGSTESLGIVPTPAVAWGCRDQSCPGVMISASHNPYADNGLKVFAAGGLKLSDETQSAIEAALIRNYEFAPEASDFAIQDHSIDTELVEGWERSLIGSVEAPSLNGLRVVLDCAHGSASESAPRVFAALGADVEVIGNQPDGCNINKGYGSTHPESLVQVVADSAGAIGFAFDGDADRVVAVDENGQVLDGDRIIALLANDLKSRSALAADTVVVTAMSNLGFHHAMRDAGVDVITTPVGDRHVLAELEEHNLSLGGEQAGHIICRNHSNSGDGILAAVQLADVIVRNSLSLAEAADGIMKPVPQVLENVKLSQRVSDIPDNLATAVAGVEDEFGDQGRVLVRPSGTEPLLRVMVEHVDESVAKETVEKLAALARGYDAS